LTENSIYRILDANCNRLREGLRVIEEYFRFHRNAGEQSKIVKKLRHSLKELENTLTEENLVRGRDTESDIFANENRAEELEREKGPYHVYLANMKRVQEAARVLEEYCKITPWPYTSEIAKKIRFDLYRLEKTEAER